MPKPTMFQISQDTEVIRARARTKDIGQMLTDAEVSALIGRTNGYGNAASALRALIAEGQVWQRVRNEGWRRMPPEEQHARNVNVRRRAARGYRRCERETATVLEKFGGQMDAANRSKLLADQSIAGALAHASSEKAANVIATKTDTCQLAINQTLLALSKE